MLTGEVWLSPAGCGLNASQELLMFLTHQHRLGQLGHVVVLSGLNSLAHEALCEVLASPNDPQHAKAYQAFLNSFSEGMQATAPLRRQSLWRRIGQALATPAVAAPVSWPVAPEKRLARAADNIGRTLRQWDRLLADSHATLTFILQPLLLVPGYPARWRASHAGRAAATTGELRPAAGRRLRQPTALGVFPPHQSQADPVPCYDMNCMLSSSPVFGADLFIDRLHLNDLGNNALAKVITAKLGLAQEKHAQRKVTPIKLV
jgi:hypothetical protein